MAAKLVPYLLFFVSVCSSSGQSVVAPQAFWKWDNTGLPIANSQRGRSSSPILDLVEPKGDSYSAWWALYNPNFVNKSPLSVGTYRRDNPVAWIGNPNNLGDQLKEGKERLLLGKRLKLSQGPRRRKRMSEFKSSLSRESRMVVIDPQFGIPIFVPDSEVQKTLSVLRDDAMVQQKFISKVIDRKDENLEVIEPPSVIQKTSLYRHRTDSDIEGPIYRDQTQGQCTTEGCRINSILVSNL